MEKKTKLTLQIGEITTSWEVPYTDSSVEELLQAFVGIMFTHTFAKVSIINEMKNYIEEYEN